MLLPLLLVPGRRPEEIQQRQLQHQSRPPLLHLHLHPHLHPHLLLHLHLHLLLHLHLHLHPHLPSRRRSVHQWRDRLWKILLKRHESIHLPPGLLAGGQGLVLLARLQVALVRLLLLLLPPVVALRVPVLTDRAC